MVSTNVYSLLNFCINRFAFQFSKPVIPKLMALNILAVFHHVFERNPMIFLVYISSHISEIIFHI